MSIRDECARVYVNTHVLRVGCVISTGTVSEIEGLAHEIYIHVSMEGCVCSVLTYAFICMYMYTIMQIFKHTFIHIYFCTCINVYIHK